MFKPLYNNYKICAVCCKVIDFLNKKDIYTVENCIAYKAVANCGVLETKQTKKGCGKVYKGCLLFSFKIHKLNYNAYNQGI